MAKGWDSIQQASAESAERRQRFTETNLPELKVGAKFPGPFYIRFLEQGPDINSYPVHEYSVPSNRPGAPPWNRKFTCFSEIGQHCPGCAAGMRKKWRGVYNVIQRQRPIPQLDSDQKPLTNPDGSWIILGYEDTVVVANVGQPTADMLRRADSDYRGLMSRDFYVTYSNDTFQAWDLKPVMDDAGNAIAVPMSEADWILAAKKYDLDAYMKPPSVEDANIIINKYVRQGAQGGGQTQTQHPAQGGYQGGGGQQGNAGQVQQPNGFLAGAQVPQTAVAGGAFGAAQAAQQPVQAAPPVPVQQPVQPPVPQPAPQPAVQTQYNQPVPGVPVTPGAPLAPPQPQQPQPAQQQ